MSLNTCKLSGVNLTRPVIDKINGYIYQKEEIEKHIIKTGQCPITGREMQTEDLLEIKRNEDISLKDNLNTSENIPNILKKINSEWENIMIYNFHLKKELEELKKESSHLLYQHEAANLVICRLLKEKEEFQNKLNLFRNQVKEINYQEQKDFETGEEFNYMGIYDELIGKINDNALTLAKARKNRSLPDGFVTREKLAKFRAATNFTNENSKNPTGYTCIDIHPYYDNLILTANLNAETTLNLYDSTQEKFSANFTCEKINTKKINFLKFYKDNSKLSYISTSNDNTASFFSEAPNSNFELNSLAEKNSKNLKNLKFSEVYRVTNHNSPIIGADFHPLKEYCLIGSKDNSWSFHNLFKGICLTKQTSENKTELNCLEFHPDGSIFACGEQGGLLKIWDLCQQVDVSTFEAHSKNVDTISFSNNGFYLASGSTADNVIKVWDLRKFTAFSEIKLDNKFDLKKIRFDSTGTYLGYAGSKLGVLNVKTSEVVVEFENHKDVVSDFAFSRNCEFIASASMDKTVKIFSL